GFCRRGSLTRTNPDTHHPIAVMGGDLSPLRPDDRSCAMQEGLVNLRAELPVLGIDHARRALEIRVEDGRATELDSIIAESNVFRIWNDLPLPGDPGTTCDVRYHILQLVLQ